MNISPLVVGVVLAALCVAAIAATFLKESNATAALSTLRSQAPAEIASIR